MTFYLYKMLGSLTEPMNLFAVLLALSAVLMLLPWERGRAIGIRSCIVLALFLCAAMILPLGQWALLPLENRYAGAHLPEKVDGIVMLTGDESPFISSTRGLSVAGHAAQRHIVLAKLSKQYPKARLIVAGNTGPFHPSEKVTTKSLIQDNLDAMNVPRDRVEYETHSRTTYENALFTKEMVKPKEGQKWLLLTSAFHMPRSALCFEKQKWDVIPYPTDYFTIPKPQRPHSLDLAHQIRLLNLAVHEYVGLVSYWAAGWIERPWP